MNMVQLEGERFRVFMALTRASRMVTPSRTGTWEGERGERSKLNIIIPFFSTEGKIYIIVMETVDDCGNLTYNTACSNDDHYLVMCSTA